MEYLRHNSTVLLKSPEDVVQSVQDLLVRFPELHTSITITRPGKSGAYFAAIVTTELWEDTETQNSSEEQPRT